MIIYHASDCLNLVLRYTQGFNSKNFRTQARLQ
jgi:hypothetical protein